LPTRPERLDRFKEPIAQALDTANDKTQQKDQIRFAARDADRIVTRVLEGQWTRSQERNLGNEQTRQQPEPARQAEQERQPERAEREARPQSRARAKGRAMERA
jgi:hypothetical protein